MHILLSNDDGLSSPGIQILDEVLSKAKHKITVVAPHTEKSTTGHSLTLHKPLRMIKFKDHQFAVSGTPADCVYMATRKILDSKPDLVISGINHGANMGSDIFYSGTVAAAREATLWGLRSIAVSLVMNHFKSGDTIHWQSAAEFIKNFAPEFVKSNFLQSHILNINVPNLPMAQIKGVKLSRQGRRVYSDSVQEGVDPRKRKYYWIGGSYTGFEDIPHSDCVDVEAGYISLVPLRIDTTDYELKETFSPWEEFKPF